MMHGHRWKDNISFVPHLLSKFAMAAAVVYTDARKDKLASAEKRQKLGLAHFNHFMKDHCVHLGVDPVEAKDIPCEGLPRQESEKDIFRFWGALVGSFFTCMMSCATRACKANGKRLSKGSADQCTSEVKNYFCGRFDVEPDIPVFHGQQWATLKRRLQGKFREHHRANNTRVVESIEGSTREDRECLATGCIWDGTAESAEFLHLLNASYHCSARGSEVSLASPEDMTSVEVNEDTCECEVIYLELQRQKDGDLQRMAIYPHRDGILEDFYFSSIYLAVMVGCDHEYLFPNFSKAALATTKAGKSASKVSSLWAKLFEELRTKFDILADKINERLSSHCNKKGSNQMMADCSSVSGIAQVFRTYGTRGRDTIWEYFNDSPVLSQACGKVLGKWTTKIGDVIVGGQPCTFKDISPLPPDDDEADEMELLLGYPGIRPTKLKYDYGDRDKLNRFTDVLFEDDADRRWQPKVRELLVMALFLRYDQFCAALRAHPRAIIREAFDDYNPVLHDVDSSREFDTIKDHLFVCRVQEALAKAGVNNCVFNKWCKEARQAFLSRNLPGIPTSKFSSCGGNNDATMMDVRCFADHFAVLSSIAQSTHVEVQQLRHRVSDLIDIVRHERIDSNTLREMSRSVARLDAHILGQANPRSVSPSVKSVKRFSISAKGLNRRASVVDATVLFFVDNFPVGMDLEQQSDSWKDSTEKEKKAHRNRFSSIKRAVRMVMMHVESFPSQSDGNFKSTLRKVAENAVAALRVNYELPEDKIVTVHTITNDSQRTSQFETTRKLPADLPESWRKIFDK